MLAAKITLPFTLGIAIFSASLLLNKSNQENLDSELFANPLLYRALSGYIHTLQADKLWLASNAISEMRYGNSYQVDEEVFKQAFETIAVMDPYFFQAINYGATYLATIKNDVKGAVTILDRGLEFAPKEFNLLFSKMLLLATYTEADTRDFETIKSLAKKLIALDTQKRFGNLSVEELIEEMFVFATSKNAKKQKEVEDLLWLYKTTKNQNVKDIIAAKLKDYGVSF